MELLKHAVAEKNHDQVVKMLKLLSNNCYFDDAVKIAVAQKDYESLRLFAAHGHDFSLENNVWSDIDEFDEDEYEPMLQCIACDDLDEKDLRSPLHMAADDAQMTRWLLEVVNAQPNNRDAQGKTALFYAIDAKNMDVVELLLKNGADTKIKTIGEQLTALVHAIYSDDSLLMARFLLEFDSSAINEPNVNGWTALRNVVDHEDLSMFEYMLKKGADPYQKDVDGKDTVEYIREYCKCGSDNFARMLCIVEDLEKQQNKRRRLS